MVNTKTYFVCVYPMKKWRDAQPLSRVSGFEPNWFSITSGSLFLLGVAVDNGHLINLVRYGNRTRHRCQLRFNPSQRSHQIAASINWSRLMDLHHRPTAYVAGPCVFRTVCPRLRGG